MFKAKSLVSEFLREFQTKIYAYEVSRMVVGMMSSLDSPS